MLRVPIVHAESGMRLALPVQHPLRGTKLLSAGFELDWNIIEKLRQLQIQHIWVEYPNAAQIKQYISPAILQEQSQMVEVVAEMFDPQKREAHAQNDFVEYRRTIQGLIEALVLEPSAAAYIVEMGGSAESGLRHAGEVCYLSVLLGLKLQGYLVQQRKRLRPSDARDVVSLGLGAVLHDIGKLSLSEDVRNRYETTRDETDSEWQRHVTLGHKMVSGSIPPAAAGVVLMHHQHFDGSGFPKTPGEDGRPRGLVGEDIHVFARIACVANHFDRLRYAPRGPLQPRVRVLRQMLMTSLSTRFDPIVLATLPMVVPAYPPGSLVTLNNGERAVVTCWHPEAPCQPTVQVVANIRGGSAEQPAEYDLRDRSDLLVVEHEGADVAADNFRLIAEATALARSAA